MRRLLLLALLPIVAHADGIIMCKSAAGVADGDLLGKCPIAERPCVTSITPGTLVRSHIDPNETHIWRKWSSLPENGPVRGCASWTTKNVLAPQITVTGAAPVPPKSAITVVAGPVLNWNAVPTATSYRVYRGTVSGVYGAPTTVTSNSYPLTGLEPGSYFYVVSWLDADGESPKSPEANVIVPAQTGLPATLNHTCTPAVAKKVGDVTQWISTCTLQ